MAESEIELKLRLDPQHVGRFRRDPLIHRSKQGRARAKRLVAVYFDTLDLDLRAARAALRIRQEGSRRVQTLKLPVGGAGLQRRVEYNAPIQGNEPDLSLIEDAETRTSLDALIAGKALVPVFTTDIRRTAWMLDLPGGAVELALDLGRIESQGRSVPVCEAELELKGGTPLSLLDFADALGARYSCHVAEESKAARGYGLFLEEQPKAVRAGKLDLDPDADAWTSLGRIVEEGTAQLFGNEAAVLQGSDIEGVHQARVAVRRTRAALSAFRAVLPDDVRRPLNKTLRRLQKALGPARDWDVFLAETLTPLLAETDAPRSLNPFAAQAEVARDLAYRQARKALRSARYGRLQLALIRFPCLPVPDKVCGLRTEALGADLWQERLQVVLTAAGEDPTELPDEALHDLRIKIKKLRYAIEFFENLHDSKSVKPWRSAIRKLQDCLGGLNDAVVQGHMIDAMDTPERPVPISVRRYLEAFLDRKRQAGMSDLARCWTQFRSLTPFWDPTQATRAG